MSSELMLTESWKKTLIDSALTTALVISVSLWNRQREQRYL
jgi:hypothetical protein